MSQDSPFRHIAPRTTTASPAPGPVEDQRVRRTPTACNECKKRRVKCSFETPDGPCTECQTNGRECIVDEGRDRRRKASVRRMEENQKMLQADVDYYRGYLDDFIRGFQQGNDASVREIIKAIQSGSSKEEIHSIISQVLRGDTSGNPPGPPGEGSRNTEESRNREEPRNREGTQQTDEPMNMNPDSR